MYEKLEQIIEEIDCIRTRDESDRFLAESAKSRLIRAMENLDNKTISTNYIRLASDYLKELGETDLANKLNELR